MATKRLNDFVAQVLSMPLQQMQNSNGFDSF